MEKVTLGYSKKKNQHSLLLDEQMLITNMQKIWGEIEFTWSRVNIIDITVTVALSVYCSMDFVVLRECLEK